MPRIRREQGLVSPQPHLICRAVLDIADELAFSRRTFKGHVRRADSEEFLFFEKESITLLAMDRRLDGNNTIESMEFQRRKSILCFFSTIARVILTESPFVSDKNTENGRIYDTNNVAFKALLNCASNR